MTNSGGELSLVFLSIKETIYYIAMIKKLIERTFNINIDIGLILFNNVEFLIDLNNTLKLKSLKSDNKKEILINIRY